MSLSSLNVFPHLQIHLYYLLHFSTPMSNRNLNHHLLKGFNSFYTIQQSIMSTDRQFPYEIQVRPEHLSYSKQEPPLTAFKSVLHFNCHKLSKYSLKCPADILADNLQDVLRRQDCPKLLTGTEFYMLFTHTVTVEWENIAPSSSNTARTINSV